MIACKLTWFSSHENAEDCTHSPLKDLSPTYLKVAVGKHSADPTLLVCSQNMTIKVNDHRRNKRGLDYLFSVENLVALLLALAGVTSTEAAMQNWLVTCSISQIRVGPF